MKNFVKALTASTLILGLVGCGVSYTGPQIGNGKSSYLAKNRAGAKWTVLVHMAAENNLYSAGLKDLNEMEAAINSDEVNLLVLFDGMKDGDSTIYKIKKDTGMNSTIVSEKINGVIPTEINSGDPTVLAKVMEWTAKTYPAQHTMMAVWNHGSGIFTQTSPNALSRGFAWDDKGSNMNTKDLSNVILPAFAKAAGQPLDILSFDACLMAHVEIGYQAKGLANYLVASEETEPGDGWDYQAWVGALSKNPSMTPAQLGSTMVDGYLASYKAGGSQAGGREQAVTLSCTDINALNETLVPAINDFAQTAMDNMAANKAALQAARGKTMSFYSSDCGDLGTFVKAVQADAAIGANIKEAAKGVENALAKTIVKGGGLGRYAGATGLVVYFPRPTQYMNAKYTNANEIAYANEKWAPFLKAYMAK